MKIPQSVRELLPKAPLAHLTTLNSDGSPQLTVVWVGIENEEFVIGHMAAHKKVRKRSARPKSRIVVARRWNKCARTARICGDLRRRTRHQRRRCGSLAAPGTNLFTTDCCFSAGRNAEQSGLHHSNQSDPFRGHRSVEFTRRRVKATAENSRSSAPILAGR